MSQTGIDIPGTGRRRIALVIRQYAADLTDVAVPRGVVLHHSQRSVASQSPRSVVFPQRSVAACGVVPLFIFHDVVTFFVFRDVVSLVLSAT